MDFQRMNKNELRKWRENYTPFTGVCVGFGMRLNVHFDEKDHLKRIGAQWDSAGKYWWIPAELLDWDMHTHGFGTIPAIVNTFDPDRLGGPVEQQTTNLSVLEWLNRNKIATNEIHGGVDNDRCEKLTANTVPETYCLKINDRDNAVFEFYDEFGIVKLIVNGIGPDHKKAAASVVGSDWSTTENARNVWNDLVNLGFTRSRYERVVS